MMQNEKTAKNAKPPWLKKSLPKGPAFGRTTALLRKAGVHTVCEEANCPNKWECFSKNTATFLILGENCTRNCSFCSVSHAKPEALDPEEPAKVAQTAAELGLDYVVLTSVTRDDLPDKGAKGFVSTMEELRRQIPGVFIEVLVPDFLGEEKSLLKVLKARPKMFNHNLETVPRLYPGVRPGAEYRRSLKLLQMAGQSDMKIPTKSGLMLGLGESEAELEQSLEDLLGVGCLNLTLGQYLQPGKEQMEVARYVDPEEFEAWKEKAKSMGFDQVFAGPFVRSSYRAKEMYEAHKKSMDMDK